MNLFSEKLDDFLVILQKKYPIHTDFRVWVKVDNLIRTNRTLTPESLRELFETVFIKDTTLPPTLQETLSAILNFFAAKDESAVSEKNSSSENAKNSKRIVDYTFDSSLIYAAFLAQYGIDLSKVHLHWWRFLALFEGLNDDNKICTVMGYRSCDASKIKDNERRAFIRKMQNYYKLPDVRSVAEIERDNNENLSKVF